MGGKEVKVTSAERARAWRAARTPEQRAEDRARDRQAHRQRYDEDLKARAQILRANLVRRSRRYRQDPVFRSVCGMRGLRKRLAAHGVPLESYADALIDQDFKCLKCEADITKKNAPELDAAGRLVGVRCLTC